MEKQIQFIYVYRYLWTEKDNENVCIKVVSGVKEEHDRFVKSILSTDKVLKCSRVYMGQYNIDLLEKYENVKEVHENEKKNS